MICSQKEEVSAELLTFHEVINHMQEDEEEVIDGHRAVTEVITVVLRNQDDTTWIISSTNTGYKEQAFLPEQLQGNKWTSIYRCSTFACVVPDKQFAVFLLTPSPPPPPHTHTHVLRMVVWIWVVSWIGAVEQNVVSCVL